ncbi:hypothetical protein M703_03485 [Neisseria gonorrhoeae SK29344]|nr:hypothetical protein M703_03485 [Neisseria gonorrhoeae SK29344]
MIWVSDGIFYGRTAAPFQACTKPNPATLRHSHNSPSFPGKWESRNAKPQELIRNNSNLKFVIPTKVGIQFVEFQLFKINFETLIPSFPRKRESGT